MTKSRLFFYVISVVLLCFKQGYSKSINDIDLLSKEDKEQCEKMNKVERKAYEEYFKTVEHFDEDGFYNFIREYQFQDYLLEYKMFVKKEGYLVDHFYLISQKTQSNSFIPVGVTKISMDFFSTDGYSVVDFTNEGIYNQGYYISRDENRNTLESVYFQPNPPSDNSSYIKVDYCFVEEYHVPGSKNKR